MGGWRGTAAVLEGENVIDDEDLKVRRKTWQTFVRIVSYVVLATVLTLLLMALLLL